MFIPIKKIKENLKQTKNYLNRQLPLKPQLAVVLGSGLGDFVHYLKHTKIIPYSKIPHFPKSTVSGHAGQLVYGTIGEIPLIVFQGRWHYYEGIPLQQATYYVRVIKELGIDILIITNAAGGLGSNMKPGDIMLITDHINLLGNNPLIGPHDDSFGARFPDMLNVYDPNLRRLAMQTAKKNKIKLIQGVYTMVSGPTYETPAELNYLRNIGTDAVGMSTVPEVIVARQAGLKILGFSAITDVIKPNQSEPLTHEQVLRVAQALGPQFTKLLIEIIKQLCAR